MSFSRAFRLWERHFPGDQNPPNDIGKFVQPIFDAMSPRVGECQFGSQVLTAVCVAGSNSVTFGEPQPGRLHKPVRLAVLFSAPAAATDVESRVLVSGTPTFDPWAAWTQTPSNVITLERRGYRNVVGAGQQNAFDCIELATLPFMMRGNFLNAAVHGAAGGESFEAHYFFIDAPAELLEL